MAVAPSMRAISWACTSGGSADMTDQGAPRFDMPLAEAMATQRAVRRLRPDPVDETLILELIALAVKAPSGSNAQNWEFVVVRDPAVKRRLGALNRMAWRVYGAIGRWAKRHDPRSLRMIEAVQWQADHFEAIPVIVVVCLRGVIPWFPRIAPTSLYGSVFPAVQNLLLAARAAGLGAALITLPLWSTLLARLVLGLPWYVTPCAVVPLGWPRGRYGPTTRRPVGEVVHLDRWGNRAFRDRVVATPGASVSRDSSLRTPS